MTASEPFPDDYLRLMQSLEPSYLQSDDPIRQSGFGGGAARWRAEREPLLEGVTGDGDLLDVGCANGYLLECLVLWGRVLWGRERGLSLVPWGVDLGPRLVGLARARFPQYADHFWVANAWDWAPPRRFLNVYALYDSVPPALLAEYVRRLLAGYVAPGGRLILGAYGSRSRGTPPFDVAGFLRGAGYRVVGESAGGDPVIARFAWVDGQGPLLDPVTGG